MTENEAIERIKKDACNNRCIPQLCNDGCMYGDTKCAFSVAIKALEEVQQYRALGTPKDLKAMKEHGAFTGMELVQLAVAMQRLREYEKIGTPKECRTAVEKQTAKKIEIFNGQAACPNCKHFFGGMDVIKKLIAWDMPHCKDCGQHLDWSEV